MPKDKGTDVVVDFSEVRPFEPLNEDQRYLCQVTKLDPGRGPKGPKLHAELTIREPKEIEIEKEGKLEVIKIDGRKLFREFSLLPQALPFLHGFLRAMGETELGETYNLTQRIPDLLGTEVAVDVTNEEYEEQVRSRPNRILPASSYAG